MGYTKDPLQCRSASKLLVGPSMFNTSVTIGMVGGGSCSWDIACGPNSGDENLEAYLAQFVCVAGLNNWTGGQKAVMLVVLL